MILCLGLFSFTKDCIFSLQILLMQMTLYICHFLFSLQIWVDKEKKLIFLVPECVFSIFYVLFPVIFTERLCSLNLSCFYQNWGVTTWDIVALDSSQRLNKLTSIFKSINYIFGG